MSAKTTIESFEHNASVGPAPGDHFAGYAVMGVTFRSGHILALRRFSASSIGPGYASVWHRAPSGRWTFYSSVAPELSCARYLGAAVEQNVLASIDLTWIGDERFRVRVGAIEWHVVLATSVSTRLLNLIGRILPERAWHMPSVLRLVALVASPMLGAGALNFFGRTPNGQRFIANPRRLWLIESTHASIDGVSLGPAGPLADQASLADLLIPQRGLFALAVAHFDQPLTQGWKP